MLKVLTFITIVSLYYSALCEDYRRVNNDNSTLVFAIVENTVALIICYYLLKIL